MPGYTLTLNVKPADLHIMKIAKQRLTLAKPVGSGDPNVIWLSIDPFESTTIQWVEEYWIYSSTVDVAPGQTITKLSEVQPGPALDAGYYPFTPSASFGQYQKSSSVPSGTYCANNDMPHGQYPALTFGLAQSAQVGKELALRKPISANSVMAKQSILMTPFTNVHVWLQGDFASETIITSVIGASTVAKFGGGTTHITLVYDADRGVFVPEQKQKVLLDSGLIELRTPLLL